MNRPSIVLLSPLLMLGLVDPAAGQEARIVIQAGLRGREVSRFMTGACIEDVNHEIYGGIYSQMVFGESFNEPPAATIQGWKAYGGAWTADSEGLHAPSGDGPKLIADRPPFGAGDVSVQIRFRDNKPGLAGLIVKTTGLGVGADQFQGYEVSLDPSRQILSIGRHRHNWEPLREVACKIPVDEWIRLDVRMTETGLKVLVGDRPALEFEDKDHPLGTGLAGLRTWHREAEFRNPSIRGEAMAFKAVDPHGEGGVSGMWKAVNVGSARGDFEIDSRNPFAGPQSQRIAFTSGEGAVGVENRGLNRWGMNFVAGKPYEGYLWMKADAPTKVYAALQSGDGSRTLAEATISVEGAEWKRHDFTITPNQSDESGRFAILLKSPGSVVVGHAFLQPGAWGRFRNLPVRKDVGEALVRQGVTVMRLGGLMANAEGYRWKNMIGPRDRRAPYKGYWYPHSSNGWGIFDFLDFCEAAGILPVVDLNLDETPKDIADFIEYANGSADSEWGRRRASDGHPDPYDLKYVELGNEEAVDESYWNRFKPLAEALWTKDPQVVPIVGDFEYKRPITDPNNFEGAPRIKSLSAHKKILDLAKTHGRPVWFDVHIWNHNPREARGPIAALPTFCEALTKISPGADFRVCVLEENSTNHAVRRAVAHGETINGLMRMGDRVGIVCAANALQPDKQNDNGWDQGLIFLDPSHAWGQPPSYVTRMITNGYRPTCVNIKVQSPGDDLDATALVGEDGGLTLQVANVGNARVRTTIQYNGLPWPSNEARVTQLTGEIDEVNTATDPERVVAWERSIKVGDGAMEYTFPPRSFTTFRFRRP